MTLAVTDANIFIDLFELKLLSLFFELDLDIYTTQEVLLECDKIQREQLQLFIKNKKLIVKNISDADALKMESMTFNKGLSEPDKSVLFVAKNENGMVISGDKLIRKWCQKNKIEVHGILWVLDEINQAQLISSQEVIEKLETLLQFNFWLPTIAANELLERWRKEL
ncbi:MAG: DUF3368 domain-containing protein [Saprospiraceae bacterium]